MAKTVGIDLGTTNSVVAVMEGGSGGPATRRPRPSWKAGTRRCVLKPIADGISGRRRDSGPA